MQSFGRLLVAATMFGVVACASAQTLLLDFGGNGSYRGATAPSPDTNGNMWNSFTPGAFVTDLVDSTGVATTIDLGFDTPVGTDSYNGPAGEVFGWPPTQAEIDATDIDAAALGDLGIKEAAMDFAAGDGGACRFQLQELDPSKTYNLTFYGSHKFNSDYNTIFTIYGSDSYSFMSIVDSGNLDIFENGSPWLHNRDTVLTISGLSPQTDDKLFIEFVGNAGGAGYLNAMKIEVVPEPASLVLLSGLLLVLRRR